MKELWITLPDNFGELLESYKSNLLGKKEYSVLVDDYKSLGYNKEKAQICLNGKTIQIPLATNQSVVCEALFEVEFGDWIKDADVRENFYKVTETSFYDAVRAINKAIKDETGISGLLKYKALRTRIEIDKLK